MAKGTNKKISQNATCPCGSGKKYKKCCTTQAAGVESFWSKATLWIFGIVLLGGIILVVLAFLSDDGAPPPGKVWSPEHGHWHDAR